MDTSCLTQKQQEILKLALSGKSQTEIAKISNCSRQNVSSFMSRIMKKTDQLGETIPPPKKSMWLLKL